MSGLKNTVSRIYGVGIGRGYRTSGEEKREKKVKKQAKVDKIYAGANVIPDEEVIKRNARRKAAGRQGSRASTVMTNQDTLG